MLALNERRGRWRGRYSRRADVEPASPPAAAFDCVEIDDAARPLRDPTGTRALRRRLRTAGRRRVRELRTAVGRYIRDENLLGLGTPGRLNVAGSSPATALAAFDGFVSRLAERALGDEWLSAGLREAYRSGVRAGARLVNAPDTGDLSPAEVYVQRARSELSGIAAAAAQQASRAAAAGLVSRLTSSAVAREVDGALRKIQTTRVDSLVEFAVVQAHNGGRLDVFAAAGETLVGVLPEAGPRRAAKGVQDAACGCVVHALADARRGGGRRLKGSHGSRKRANRRVGRAEQAAIEESEGRVSRLGRVYILTAGDDDVCSVCEDLAAGGPYPIDTARGLIPSHPNCRCAFTPAGDRRYARYRRRGRE